VSGTASTIGGAARGVSPELVSMWFAVHVAVATGRRVTEPPY
jgi:hypothetical protein